MEKGKKEGKNKNTSQTLGKRISYGVGVIAIILSGVALVNGQIESQKLQQQELDESIERIVYLNPEINFVDQLTFHVGEKVKVLDLVKNASHCVIIDDGAYVDTSTPGIKTCTLRITDDIGEASTVSINVDVIE